MPHLPPELTSEINLRPLKRAAWTLAPLLALTLLTGDINWLKASVVTISLFIVYERVGLAPLGVACHALVLLLAFLALLLAMRQPAIFVLVCTLAAAAAVGVSAYGGKLRSLGNFTFIPALYLACETAEGVAPAQVAQRVLPLLPYLAAAVLPVLTISLVEHVLAGRRWHHVFKLHRNGDLGARVACGEALFAVGLAVALAAAIVEWGQLGYGQWVIWSAVSVVTGDTTTARKKLYQRGAGAMVGVPVGVSLGYIMPHSVLMYEFLTVAAMLTLVSFSHYALGFGARCACIASALMVIGQTPEIAAERALNVLLGGGIGLLFVFLLHFAVAAKGGVPK
ncbi:TIGR01666 family membrane protein [Serratia entomophila]|uniref:FUSC family protein n=1 Tax=Serratia entomophila TaxID=42906 RepID=UPI00217B3969|nr:FUSC family protein [Serratia entomophila]CAI0811351.1 TIGR01666 family membrane protein [Serratia entomophila]CAI1539496.1 TIGR01666 family membrane protein [Serratia entomophila]CAI1646567.1 TIGR01666 family membrane protein [Serratia entomophila]CAI1821133.1 TIGR01666 family membrane protein [Serratia entomophila]CAI2012275.1 TIGR01666 family membrane protein [Serratia entomophila]